ncbi:unnamed protein product [Owenia fusiformis]|uniref:Uncharacterized protein n=1 Tax=Owenia fusiformis TaxID=6347 RepID=A0A8S4NLE2_OWEFU|nr:unnamed protein product [Owenia fusiformis]
MSHQKETDCNYKNCQKPNIHKYCNDNTHNEEFHKLVKRFDDPDEARKSNDHVTVPIYQTIDDVHTYDTKLEEMDDWSEWSESPVRMASKATMTTLEKDRSRPCIKRRLCVYCIVALVLLLVFAAAIAVVCAYIAGIKHGKEACQVSNSINKTDPPS